MSLLFYDLDTEKTAAVELSKAYDDFYIPRIKWTKDPDVLSAQYLNRHQNALDLWLINPTTNKGNLVLSEKDEAYVDVTDNLTFLDDNSFIWTSEKDGFNHIYHYAKDGKLKNQITKGNWEVTAYYGFNASTKTIYYQSVENGSINRDVYSIRLNGKNKKRLSLEEGTNAADFSADFTYFIKTYSSATTPPKYTLNDSKTEPLKHHISISTNADCFQKSMAMAIAHIESKDVDIIIMHAPGTLKGDRSEYMAIKQVFNAKIPTLTSNKWKIGHTLGASGGFSLELAIHMLKHQKFISVPFLNAQKHPNHIKKILVNAVGFGGNAVSILVSLN